LSIACWQKTQGDKDVLLKARFLTMLYTAKLPEFKRQENVLNGNRIGVVCWPQVKDKIGFAGFIGYLGDEN
jgi:hypothetical protein